MAYNEDLGNRIREALAQRSDVTEQKMFGGLAFMISGNMCVGVSGPDGRMLVRVGKEAHDEAMAQPYASVMDFTNKPMKGFIYVEAAGVESDADLKAWVKRGLAFVETLPPKQKKK
jgi:TfoX/Sxy family transcriptional regulator of competence genes